MQFARGGARTDDELAVTLVGDLCAERQNLPVEILPLARVVQSVRSVTGSVSLVTQ